MSSSNIMAERLTGCVKWFNTKAGYGFVTVTQGDRAGEDYFVHHSAIHVSSNQYKYLVQGEYIEFVLGKVESDKHKWQATDISGIGSGKLMCETKFLTSQTKPVVPVADVTEKKKHTAKTTTAKTTTAKKTGDKNGEWVTVANKRTKA